jgi:hypothetical protein
MCYSFAQMLVIASVVDGLSADLPFDHNSWKLQAKLRQRFPTREVALALQGHERR